MSNQKPQPQGSKVIKANDSMKGIGQLKPKPTTNSNNSNKGK